MNKTYTVVAPKTEAQIEGAIRICITGEAYTQFAAGKNNRTLCPILTPSDLEQEVSCAKVHVMNNSEGVPTCYCGTDKYKPDSNGRIR
jgi:hypothetical protein